MTSDKKSQLHTAFSRRQMLKGFGTVATVPIITFNPLANAVTCPPEDLSQVIRIDAHTHIFNARALPVEGFVWHMIGAEIGNLAFIGAIPGTKRLARSLVKLLNKSLRKKKLTAEREIAELTGILDGDKLLTTNTSEISDDLSPEQEEQFFADLDESLEQFPAATEAVYQFIKLVEYENASLNEPSAKRLLKDTRDNFDINIEESLIRESPKEHPEFRQSFQQYQGWASAMDENLIRETVLATQFERSRQEKDGLIPNPINVVRGFVLSALKRTRFKRTVIAATSTHLQNMQRLIRHFSLENKGISIDQFVVAPVDMDFWVGHDGKTDDTSLEEQYEIVNLLQQVYSKPARLIPFGTFDPWRQLDDVLSGKKITTLDLLKKAVSQYNFKGVKLYPQMGWRPINNRALDHLDLWPKAASELAKKHNIRFGEQLDKILLEFFSWAADNNIPIMAHGNPTLGASAGYENRGSAIFWRMLLETRNEENETPLRSLRLNLGHFGGIKNIVSGDDWTQSIINLMLDFPKVYGDLSNYNDIKESNYRTYLADTLTRLPGPVRKRLLYGSDWWMLYSDTQWKSYTKNMISMIDEIALPKVEREAFKADLLGCNAKRFLNIP